MKGTSKIYVKKCGDVGLESLNTLNVLTFPVYRHLMALTEWSGFIFVFVKMAHKHRWLNTEKISNPQITDIGERSTHINQTARKR